MALKILHGELPDGYSIKTFAIREKVTGDLPAIQASIARFHPDAAKGGGDGYFIANITETVRHLLVEVDGKQLEKKTPFMEMDQWSYATTEAIAELFFNAFKANEGKAKGKVIMT